MHSHDHNHNHNFSSIDSKSAFTRKIFLFGILLNIGFAVIELIYGFLIDSMALISDAGHNFLDVLGLILAYAGIWLSKIRPNKRFTYGYRKTTILASVFNSIFLFTSVIFILKESIERLFHPVSTVGTTIMWIAGIGIIINSLSGYLFMKLDQNDVNIRAAFIHLIADALVSVGVVISGFIIYKTDLYIMDPIVSIVISVIILLMTFRLLKQSIFLAIDAVPDGVDVDEIEQSIGNIKGVMEIHHIHVWAMSSSENAITAHLVLDDNIEVSDLGGLKSNIRHVLLHHNIQHSTMEFESKDEKCKDCHLL
ncbi:MAG: cation diffusion facilitator family transporter [Saprospiraceae bacterium]